MYARMRWGALGSLLALALVGVVASPASAATSSYHPNSQARNFATGDGGWSASVANSSGLCPIGCAQIASGFAAGGGAGGGSDGFLRSSVTGLASVLNTSTVTWQSPAFIYNGAAGLPPTSLRFALARRSAAAALLAALDTATYSVTLVNVASGEPLTVIETGELTDSPDWSVVAPVALNPGALAIGQQYRIRLVMTLAAPVAVLPGGNFDWDDVALTASRPGSSLQQARRALTNGVAGVARLRGNRLLIRVRCPKAAPARCRTRLAGLLSTRRSKRVTRPRTVTVRRGASRLVKLRVRKRFLRKVRRKRKLLFRVRTVSGPVKVVYYRKLRLRRR